MKWYESKYHIHLLQREIKRFYRKMRIAMKLKKSYTMNRRQKNWCLLQKLGDKYEKRSIRS